MEDMSSTDTCGGISPAREPENDAVYDMYVQSPLCAGPRSTASLGITLHPSARAGLGATRQTESPLPVGFCIGVDL